MRLAGEALDRSPGPLDVLESDQPSAVVDEHPDRIETDRPRPRPRPRAPSLGQPRERQPAQASPLTGSEPFQRLRCSTSVPLSAGGRARAAGLDLGEHEHPLAEHDHVDLPLAGAHVAGDHPEPPAPEVLEGEQLAAATELQSRIAQSLRFVASAGG